VLLSLNQWCTSPLRLQASDCSTFLSMCEVPRMAAFCNESMECLPGNSSRYFHRHLVTVPVAPMTTAVTKHFMFHIHWISMHTFLYFNFFSASLCVTFLSDGSDTSFLFCILLARLYLLRARASYCPVGLALCNS
jgi:hypothetical protein